MTTFYTNTDNILDPLIYLNPPIQYVLICGYLLYLTLLLHWSLLSIWNSSGTPCFFAQIDLQAEEIVQTVDEHPTKTAGHAKGNDHQLLRKTMKTKPFWFFENRSVAKVKIRLA